LRKIAGANAILDCLSNGKARYADIEKYVKPSSSGLLDKYLKSLLEMEIIEKVSPINKQEDSRKSFYQIRDNLTRFYFAYIFRNGSQLTRLGEDAFYDAYIAPSVDTFIAYRFEDVSRQYFSRLVKSGQRRDIYDIGTYWYDDPEHNASGEFDCVLKHKKDYSFYECKFRKKPLALSTCEKEEEQIARIVEPFHLNKIGFISLNGYAFESDQYDLITADEMFAAGLGSEY